MTTWDAIKFAFEAVPTIIKAVDGLASRVEELEKNQAERPTIGDTDTDETFKKLKKLRRELAEKNNQAW